MVADILDGRRPADMPVRFLSRPDETIQLFDLDAALNCGITIPAKYLFRADYIFEGGVLSGR
jgi:putative ABC transport system substrate-binding protein